MTAYYNEIDPYAAQWLRNLIAGGHIAPGDVDERSISDVRPSDLVGYTQCHFFAGIGVWSYALRGAGWPDDRPVWTGSCPCQPFSAAGKGDGFADERHLWPHWYWLIRERRPAAIVGEQVASKDADSWVDLVQTDLETVGYAFGCIPFPAASVGAPHIRDRNYWVADNNGELGHRCRDAGARGWVEPADSSSSAFRLEHGFGEGLEGQWSGHPTARGQREGALRPVAAPGELGGIPDSVLDGSQGRQSVVATGGGRRSADAGNQKSRGLANWSSDGRREECANTGRGPLGDRAEGFTAGSISSRSDCRPGPTNGIWGDADWLLCRDGKWRPVEPGTFPLAHGAASRVGRLRAYGNAIVSEAARNFIEVYLEHERAALDRDGDLTGHNGGPTTLPADDFEVLA